MLPTTPNGAPMPPVTEPQLTDRTQAPQGVVRKNLKQLGVIGCVLIVVLAGFVSSFRKKPGMVPHAQGTTAVPAAQPDNTANNVATLHSTLGEERQRQLEDAQAAQALAGVPTQPTAAVAYGPNGLPAAAGTCVPGQPCSAAPGYVPSTQTGGGQAQLSPEEQEAQQLAAKERERQYASRFESNLVYSAAAEQQRDGAGKRGSSAGQPAHKPDARPGGRRAAAGRTDHKRSAEVNVDSAVGQPYVLYEGTTLDTVLMNRLDGDAAGPVKVLVSNPVYSHDHQHVIIPEGTVVLGEARKIGCRGLRPAAPDGCRVPSPADAGRLLGRSRSVPRSRPDRAGGTQGQGEQPLPRDLRHLGRTGRHLRCGADHRGRRRL